MHFAKKTILLVFTTCVSISSISGASNNDQPTLIGSLRRHYLSLESDLWKLIASGTDTRFVLSQMHIIHHTFLTENFHEFSVSWDNREEDQLQLFDTFNAINISTMVLLKNYLHKNPTEFNDQKSVRAALELEGLIHHFDKIFNITGLTPFYTVIKDVSVWFLVIWVGKRLKVSL